MCLLMPSPNIKDTEFAHKVLQVSLEMQNNKQVIFLARETLGTLNKSSPRLGLPQLKFRMFDFVIQRSHCVRISLDCYNTPQNFLGSFTLCSISVGLS